MTIVAGVDFGTLSVRVTLVDSQKGPIGTASASYPLHRRREDPNFATQSHADQMAALAAATREVLEDHRRRRQRRRGHCARHHRLQRDSGGRGPRTAGRILPVVRSSRLRRGRGDHRQGARTGLRRHRVVRRRLLPRVGIRQAAALAAPQPGEARPLCDRAGALRHGGGHAVRHHDRRRAEAQRLRHGPQVDVESQVGRAAAGGVSGRRGPAVCRGARQDGRRVPDQRSPGRASFAEVGRGAGAAAPEFPFPWAHSTRTGTPSAPTSARATR